jgi:diguanylate cyclase (GGDEF)-like protein
MRTMLDRSGNRLTQWICDAIAAEKDSLAPYRDRIMMSMGAVTVPLLIPFIINHLLQQRLLLALSLSVVELCILANTLMLWRGRPAPVPHALLLVPFVAGMSAAVVLQGVPGVLWNYPVIVYCYFALNRRVAIFCSLALLLHASLLALLFIDPTLALRLFGTLLLTIVMINIVLNVISDLHRSLARQALTDPLTGAFNRRVLDDALQAIVARARRRPLEASLLLIDIDHFKRVNDELGHDRGDRVLQALVRIVATRTRTGDRLFRWGGEEFVLLLEETALAGALQVAEDLRHAVGSADLLPGRPITISIGVGQYHPGATPDDWLRETDSALYRAKAAGRDRVVAASSPSPVVADAPPAQSKEKV